MGGCMKMQVGKHYGRNKPFILLVLAICAALASGGCAVPAGTGEKTTSLSDNGAGNRKGEEDQAEQGAADPVQKPAYVYYIKDADLMRADVNGPMESGKNPSLVMAGIGKNVNLKDYYDVSLSEDGSFLAFQFETDGGLFLDDAVLVAVNNEDGTSQIIHEGYANTAMCGNKLLFQVEHEAGNEAGNEAGGLADVQYDLYSYTPEQGKKLEASGLYNFFPSKDGSAVCITKMDEEWVQDLYLAEDGREVLLADEMNFAGANEDYSVIYAQRTVEEEEGFYYELLKLGKDGAKEPVLTKEDQAGAYYLDPDSGNLYTFVYGKEGRNTLSYSSEGEKKLLSDQVSMVWEYISEPEWLDGKSMIIYQSGPAGKETLYEAVDGNACAFTVPGMPEDWLDGYFKKITGMENGIYLTVSKLNDAYQAEESWIYRYKLSSGQLSQTPECVAHGTDLYLVDERDGKAFYTDSISGNQILYCEGTRILDKVNPETLRQLDGSAGEYFVFQEKDGAVPDLMRITTAGSSKVFRENVVQCEPYAGGMLLLSDCRDSYPYLGTLSFYNTDGTQVIDEGVTVFFQHDRNRFVDVVPWDWNWSGQDENGALGEYANSDFDPGRDYLDRAYIDGSVFYNTEYGFHIDLKENENQGYYHEIHGFGDAVSLACFDEEGNERYSIYMTDGYTALKEYDNAAAFGQWMKDVYDSTMKEYGYDIGEDDFTVEKAEDILLDGRKAIKLVTHTDNGLMTAGSTFIRYFIPDEENDRMIELSRQFLADLEDEEDLEAYQMFVESLKWDD